MINTRLESTTGRALHRTLRLLSTSLIAGVLSAGSSFANGLLFDFGADAAPTEGGAVGEANYWNNITGSVGSTHDGFLPNLLLTDGNFTGPSSPRRNWIRSRPSPSRFTHPPSRRSTSTKRLLPSKAKVN